MTYDYTIARAPRTGGPSSGSSSDNPAGTAGDLPFMPLEPLQSVPYFGNTELQKLLELLMSLLQDNGGGESGGDGFHGSPLADDTGAHLDESVDGGTGDHGHEKEHHHDGCHETDHGKPHRRK